MHAATPAPLEETVVSAHRLPSAAPTSIAARQLDATRIARARVGSLVELLQREPGLYVTDAFGDGTQTTLAMRGFGGNASANALVVVDGRELNTADLATPDLDLLTLADIAEVQLLSGSSAVRYGDQSTGGVVYLVTRPAGEGDSQLRVATGSDGRRELDGSFDTKLGSTGVRLSAKRHVTDGFRDGAEADKTDLLARIGHDFGIGSLEVEWQRVERDRVALGALTRSQRRADRQQPGSILETDADTENWRLGWHSDIGPAQFAVDLFRTDYDAESPSSSPTFGNSLTTIERQQTAIDPRLSLALGDALLTIGADIDRHEIDFANDSDAFGTSGSEQRIDSRGVWLTGSMAVAPALTLDAGARRTWVDTQARGFVLGGFASSIEQDLSEHVTSWDLGAAWRVSEQWRLAARVASGFRLPKADEQVSVFSGFNPLRTQESRSLEFNASYAGDALGASASLYGIESQHEIDFDPRAGFFGENLNLGDTSRLGALLRAQWRITDALELHAHAEWVRARQDDGGERIPFVPRRHAGAVLDWAALSWLDLRLEGRYVGPRYAIGDFTGIAGELGGYTTVDAAAHVRFGELDLTLRVDNLADREFDALVSYVTFLLPDVLTFQPDGGRRALATLTWRPGRNEDDR